MLVGKVHHDFFVDRRGFSDDWPCGFETVENFYAEFESRFLGQDHDYRLGQKYV
jgi:hypothetical protein